MTPKKPLTIGDKVHIYGRPSPGCGIGAWASVVVEQNEGPHEGESISVRAEFGLGTFDVHPKQCRRLRPRKREEPKQERIERYFAEYVTGDFDAFSFLDLDHIKSVYAARSKEVALDNEVKRFVRCVELRPGERILSRKELAEAFGQAFCDPKNSHKEMDPDLFDAMAKALGFEKEGK